MLLETYALTLAMLLETHALTLRRGTGDIKGMKTCFAMLLETYDKVDDYTRLIEFGAQVQLTTYVLAIYVCAAIRAPH